ncbi:ComEA family DNA-binding protein [Nonomuraea sp. NPDC026600]|uniref:ComEA family DNA-binding protein n=1 Tax=Nonomuraea sp. NPDC026600 TaxID=3155363 RepID=UPI0033E6FB63
MRPGWAPIPPSFEAFRQAVTTRPPASLDPGKPGLRILIALAVLAAVVAGVIAWRSQPTPEPLPAPIPSPPVPSSPSPTAKVTVHITGKVHKPGLYTLAMGARVADALTAAGGPLRGTAMSSVNLARRLVDGEQIVIGAPSGPTQADPATTTLDLNSATPDQLEQLPGVGEVLAARIADFRTTHGGFTSIDQLREVSGIGAKKYEEIKGKVHV